MIIFNFRQQFLRVPCCRGRAALELCLRQQGGGGGVEGGADVEGGAGRRWQRRGEQGGAGRQIVMPLERDRLRENQILMDKYIHIYPWGHSDLDNSVFVSLSRELFCFDYVLYQ